MEYIYLVRPQHFVLQNEPTYKLGLTKQAPQNRMKGYPQGQLFALKPVANCRSMEKELIATFKKLFVFRSEFGNETFSGDVDDMITIIDMAVVQDKIRLKNKKNNKIILKNIETKREVQKKMALQTPDLLIGISPQINLNFIDSHEENSCHSDIEQEDSVEEDSKKNTKSNNDCLKNENYTCESLDNIETPIMSDDKKDNIPHTEKIFSYCLHNVTRNNTDQNLGDDPDICDSPPKQSMQLLKKFYKHLYVTKPKWYKENGIVEIGVIEKAYRSYFNDDTTDLTIISRKLNGSLFTPASRKNSTVRKQLVSYEALKKLF
jgi:hypothetical protein